MALLSKLARELSWQSKSLFSYSPSLPFKRGTRHLQKVTSQYSEEVQYRYGQLQEKYQLGDWVKVCSPGEYIENLYILDILDRYVPKPSAPGAGMDIGCRNFSHLPALSAFYPADWLGVELDANARYLNGFTRRAYGEWMAKQRPGSRYVAGSLLEVQERADLIVWVLPFVVRAPLQHWGLPDRYFQPRALLQHATSLLQENGNLLIVNQAQMEMEAQQALLNEVGISAQALGELDSVFSRFRQSRFGYLVSRR